MKSTEMASKFVDLLKSGEELTSHHRVVLVTVLENLILEEELNQKLKEIKGG